LHCRSNYCFSGVCLVCPQTLQILLPRSESSIRTPPRPHPPIFQLDLSIRYLQLRPRRLHI
jgi:hypothetical protein